MALTPYARALVRCSMKSLIRPTTFSRSYALKSPKTQDILSSRQRKILENEWPQHMFEVAAANGQIPMRPISVKGEIITYSEFLDSLFNVLHSKGNKKQLGEYLEYFGMLPRTLTWLAILLKRADTHSADRRYREVARDLMLAASSRGDQAATYYLAGSAIRSGTFNNSEIQPVWDQIDHLVKQNDRTAMLLLAVKEQSLGKLDRALEMAETSRRLGNVGYQSEGEIPEIFVPEPWHIIRSIMKQKKDVNGARKAVEDGILLDSDPQAYFDFAIEYLTRDDKRCIRYLTKAAASGICGAALEVGRCYIIKAIEMLPFPPENGTAESSGLKNCLIAEQWFRAGLTHPEALQEEGEDLERAVFCILACGILKRDIQDSCKQLRRDLKEHGYVGELTSHIKMVQDKAGDLELARKIIDRATAY